ncbi:DNA-binding response regulator, OmpR family, contains REC and winged-helix (wHTH) domain [Alkalithermobacter thermoalcaliphilus JW-YL-7 = DSM 7308]|uniref:Stage 0 sporulation protein A homolog n=1 Tax=Alkalithermobacter thermoalcaliphilus JW-YL-7 = DSM 7308 TaxID=1121328 RepID=A0A150FR93_CLOPD|nr:two component transcriptional regulator, winged helix family [[Clostridium] paradoxum JW-YL-7 = DSM 7308]SHL02176.1 DNA-binding response regulator, OmpR family, contains REC and winged-helix (wHTH) domain [[Clostridium] paradoxum JW-YL-7 = DSM 7308]
MKIKLLIVDDETLLIKGMRYGLGDEYEIDEAYDGQEAVKKSRNKEYDIIILDLMLPKKDGLEVCKEIRTFSQVPIIMLTAKGEDMTKVMGLEFGADDYMTKPFNLLELKARIKAILRRTKKIDENANHSEFEIGEFKVNTLGRKIIRNGEDINLTGKEFDLFLFLATNKNKVFSREALLEKIWGYDYYGDLRTVDVHIRRLREKIEYNSSNPKYILTKWGAGYYFKD